MMKAYVKDYKGKFYISDVSGLNHGRYLHSDCQWKVSIGDFGSAGYYCTKGYAIRFARYCGHHVIDETSTECSDVCAEAGVDAVKMKLVVCDFHPNVFFAYDFCVIDETRGGRKNTLPKYLHKDNALHGNTGWDESMSEDYSKAPGLWKTEKELIAFIEEHGHSWIKE